jgi:hypothetical protein
MRRLSSYYFNPKIFKNRLFVSLLVIVVAIGLLFAGHSIKTSAESYSGGTDNGLTSILVGLNNTLVSDGYGSTTNSPNEGLIWNRITTASEFTPSANATASEVLSGDTFYSNSRTQNTGTYPAPGPCPNQLYVDNYGNPVTQTSNCTSSVVWTVPAGSPSGTDHYDPRTGLYWSQNLIYSSGSLVFSTSGTANQWTWNNSGSNNVAVGNLTAAQLCTAMGNGWRLPTQREVMQAYIDGANFNLGPGNIQYQAWWTDTLQSSTSAFFANIGNGIIYNTGVTSSFSVRCVAT